MKDKERVVSYAPHFVLSEVSSFTALHCNAIEMKFLLQNDFYSATQGCLEVVITWHTRRIKGTQDGTATTTAVAR